MNVALLMPPVPSWLGVLTEPAPWPLGLVSALLAGVLLWPIGGRLRLRPALRAAAIALFGTVVAISELGSDTGADGRAALLLALAGWLAVGGRLRSTLALAACVAAAIAAPVALVGVLALLGGMALTRSLGTRWRLAWRRVIAAVAFAAAAAVLVAAARPELPGAVAPIVPVALTAWAVLIVALLWPGLSWTRAPGAAVVVLAASTWAPGLDADAVVLVSASAALLTVVLAEEDRTALTGLAMCATALIGAAMTLLALTAPPTAPPLTPRPAEAPLAIPADAGPVAPAAAQIVRPTAFSVPVLGIGGPLAELSVDPETGALLAPDDPAVAGWFADGVIPGNVGPALIGGHVDSRRGPGVFFDLHRLREGDVVEVERSDGRTARFTVTAVLRVPKDRFPTTDVYGPTPGPELRLVTCGGRFDRRERSYEDNVVVEAVRA